MMKKGLFFLSVAIPAFFFSCQNKLYIAKEKRDWRLLIPPDSAEKEYSVYLIGDAGYAGEEEPALRALQNMILPDSNSTTVFLGDNIYHEGMPADTGTGERKTAEARINEQLEAVEGYPGNVFFIPGNHDWDYQGREGWAKVLAQEQYIENYLKRGNTFVPDGGCPGPYRVSAHENLVLIMLDTQWWLHQYRKPSGGWICSAEDESEMLVRLRDIIDKNQGRHIVVMGHHPLVSNGNHGGYYNALDHFFPLRLIRHRWYYYVPLPGLGSLYPLFRKFGGSTQDIPNYRYQLLIKNLMDIFRDYDNVIYVSGHEHNLQYHVLDEDFHHIISGAGCKLNPLKIASGASYVQKKKGFARVNFYSDGEAWLEFWTAEEDEGAQLSFRTMMYRKQDFFPESYCTLSRLDYSDSSITIPACRNYLAGNFERYWFGDHYRTTWATPVKVPLLDLQNEKGGLIPYELGGGNQSLTLKLKNPEGREYVLRTVNKDPSRGAIPEELLNTFAEDLVQDQISAQHPYAPVTIPPLARRISVLHTEPKLVYVPADSCLGPYFDEFSNTLVTLEEDPDEAHTDAPHLGYTENIIGSDRLEEKLLEDNDNSVDQRAFLRARLLDMLIGDWDRHAGQYRWAEFEKEDKGECFLPVPEDRDQAYFKFDGVIPWMAGRKWAVRELTHFGHEFHDVVGLNLPAKEIDRRYLTALSRGDWLAAADSIQDALPDEVIEAAISELPQAAFALSGQEIISKLKSRREQLRDVAGEYYEVLAKYVDVRGSNKHEKFVVQRLNDDSTLVTVYKIKKDEREEQTLLYRRTFLTSETKEVRLYGFKGNDIFLIGGKADEGILIRIIGGDDRDTITDRSRVSGLRDYTVVYDNEESTFLEVSPETNNKLSDDLYINDYSQDEFFYNYLGPVARFQYNQGDGLFLGAGFILKRYKFRRNPYGEKHMAGIAAATAARSLWFRYQGDYRRVIGENDLQFNIDVFAPYFAMNYFGYGNTSVRLREDIDYYRVRMYYGIVNPSIVRRITEFFHVGAGPKFEHFDLVEMENSFVDDVAANETEEIYEPRSYAGLRAFYLLGDKDQKANPTRGLILKGELFYNSDINDFGSGYLHAESDFTFYVSPNLPWQLTFAGRVGGAVNFGDFFFYQANTLGGLTNLRGHVRTRFVGDHSFYQNFEVRSELFAYNLYFIAGKIGVLGFIDNGRVWPGGGSFHTAYGGGIWTSLIQRFVLSGHYGISEDDHVINVRLGFFY